MIWHIASKAKEINQQMTDVDWEAACPVTDTIAMGYRKFANSLLTTFNKKLAEQGISESLAGQPELDKIAPCQLVRHKESGESEQTEELSALHDDNDD
jgi:hypothetical protein